MAGREYLPVEALQSWGIFWQPGKVLRAYRHSYEFPRACGVSVIDAKYFPAYFERLSENRTAAELWEKRERLDGVGGD